MQYIIKEPTAPSFKKLGIIGRVFPSALLTSKAGFFTVETELGHESTIIQHQSDFCYFVLEGAGEFLINDIKYGCGKGDLIVIPQGTKFTYRGSLRMFAISIPPWSEAQEETVEYVCGRKE